MVKQRQDKNVKQANQNLLYKEIYKNGPYTRKDLAIRLDFSLPTLAQHVKTMCDAGLIEEKYLDNEAEEVARVGRRAKYLMCCPQARIGVGMEIRPKRVQLILVDLFGNTIAKESVPLPFKESDEYSRRLAEILEDYLESRQIEREKVLGVGFSFHGVINQTKPPTLFSYKLPVKAASAELLTKYIPYPSAVHENGYCAGISEAWSRKGKISAFYMWLGDCLTGTNIQNGVVHKGQRFESGQIGHMEVVKGGKEHFCGHKGCFDAYCSSDCLTEGYGTLEDFFAALKQGEKKAGKRWEEYLQILCMAIENIHLVTSSDIILGGPVACYARDYEASIQSVLAERDIYLEEGGYLKFAIVKEDASVRGAALVLIEQFLREML
jgi:predicted NBD/HSP70 family sugar kinase